MATKYVKIKLKDGTIRQYEWDKVDFAITSASPYIFVVHGVPDVDGNKELIFSTLAENIQYYERIEENNGNESISN